MKLLSKEFKGKGQVKGYFFRQIRESNGVFIYEVSPNGYIHYEVFKRRELLNGFTNERYVAYPGKSHFGLWAWTCMTLDRAEFKLFKIDEERRRLQLQTKP